MKMSHLMVGVAMSLGLLALTAQGADAATTFADFSPSSSSANVTLSGLSLTANAPVVFDFLETPALAAFGDLQGAWAMSATETGATAFGPLALATFDGSFSFTYTGLTQTIGAITINPGDNLLSGTFLGSVFTGYGSSGSLDDSVLGGGLVSYSSHFLTFDPLGDQGISLALTTVSPAVQVVGGQLTNFTAVSSGNFSAGITSAVPEPATWAMMLLGFGGLGLALRSQRRLAIAA